MKVYILLQGEQYKVDSLTALKVYKSYDLARAAWIDQAAKIDPRTTDLIILESELA